MTMRTLIIIAATIFVGLIALGFVNGTLYAVDETQYALHFRFGEVKKVHTTPGLKIKAPIPFMDTVQRIDKRTLRADIPPREVPDRDKERLIIDIVIRYRIEDPLQFRKTLRNEANAHERLQTITYSAMRDTIAEHDRTEVIGARPKLDADGKIVNDEEGLPEYESLIGTRDAIGQRIHARIAEAVILQKYGISIISADIKRADFPHQVTNSIIKRLHAERQRVAARHRADGEEQYSERTATVQAEADIIVAEAQRDARQIRGLGDAKAIAIVQESLSEDPEFYRFLRTLESYETSIRPGATIIMTAEADNYLHTLLNPPLGRRAQTDDDASP